MANNNETKAPEAENGLLDPEADDKAPAAVPDPFDPERFRLTNTAEAEFGVVQKLRRILIRKPSKQEFFRCHPTLQLTASVIELKGEDKTLLVLPAVAASLPGEVTNRVLTLCINRQQNVFLWLVPTPQDKASDWAISARDIAAMAQKQWVRMIANMSEGQYDVLVAEKYDAEPVWPDIEIRDVLRLAFGEDNIVKDHHHPAIAKLRGGL
ncbi:hypothetical protein [Pseudomonas sp. 18173]|uniref:hypothetical protein n=1 Tax=Pseudomonas sp. 18173 TaxID=3390055 RepID=UPI003D244FEF